MEAHCEERGHGGFDTTLGLVNETYCWDEMENVIRKFSQTCIHCIISTNGKRLPQILATAVHGKRPNKAVHMDYLYLRPAGVCDLKYLLLIKDDLSAHTCLDACDAAATRQKRLIKMHGKFCIYEMVSDRPVI